MFFFHSKVLLLEQGKVWGGGDFSDIFFFSFSAYPSTIGGGGIRVFLKLFPGLGFCQNFWVRVGGGGGSMRWSGQPLISVF